MEMVEIPNSNNIDDGEPNAAVEEETALLGDENVPCQVQVKDVDEVQKEEIIEQEIEEEMALLPCDSNQSAKAIMVDEKECTFISTNIENRGNFRNMTPRVSTIIETSIFICNLVNEIIKTISNFIKIDFFY